MRSNSCWAPPASAAFGRSGCANSRCFVTAGRLGGLAAVRRGLVGQLLRGLAAGGAVGLRGRGGGRSVARRQLQVLGRDRLLLRRRVALGDPVEVPVRVRVAVHVLEHHVPTEALGLARADDAAVVDGEHGRARAREDLDVAALGGLDDEGGVALLDLAAALDLTGVGGLRVHREATLRQAGERPDEVARQAADHLGAQQHGVDVPVRVVVGEDRAADVGVGARGLQVPRGGEDRVDRVVRVLDAVAVGVDPVRAPARWHELHPAQGSGRGDVEVAAVVGLDLVDRGEDLPAHAVLDAGGLVDRQQEGRDPELVDEEVRHADPGGAGLGDRVARVRRGRRAVGVALAVRIRREALGLVRPLAGALARAPARRLGVLVVGPAGGLIVTRRVVARASVRAVAAAAAVVARALVPRRGGRGRVDLGGCGRRLCRGRRRRRRLDRAEVDDRLHRRRQARDLQRLDRGALRERRPSPS